ncbi:MAG: hypothetical protein MSG64_15780 [Pyrinomonadaceae bacterium MAG19_C2-C3]|nr:hypothetical protein [Pyrinomonadaceae bacterium MAG19_C2-C3]
MSNKITDADIYDALISMGWLIPTTEREVALREQHIAEKGETFPPLPEELKDPTPLIDRLRREEENAELLIIPSVQG